MVRNARIRLAVSRVPWGHPHSIRGPGGGPHLTVKHLPRRSMLLVVVGLAPVIQPIRRSQIAVYPANLWSFSGYVEFRGFGDDFDESVSETVEKAVRRCVSDAAAEHFQNMLSCA